MLSISNIIRLWPIKAPTNFYTNSFVQLITLLTPFVISACLLKIILIFLNDKEVPIGINLLISSFISILVCASLYMIVFNWFNEQNQVDEQIHSAIINRKSNRYVTVRNYRKVISVKDNAAWNAYKNPDKDIDTDTIKNESVYVKYENQTVERFSDNQITMRYVNSTKSRKPTITVADVKLTKEGKIYQVVPKRIAIITYYKLVKPVKWEKIKD